MIFLKLNYLYQYDKIESSNVEKEEAEIYGTYCA